MKVKKTGDKRETNNINVEIDHLNYVKAKAKSALLGVTLAEYINNIISEDTTDISKDMLNRSKN